MHVIYCITNLAPCAFDSYCSLKKVARRSLSIKAVTRMKTCMLLHIITRIYNIPIYVVCLSLRFVSLNAFNRVRHGRFFQR